ncbi:MAG: ABC transporter permease, partial [Desulfobacterales bacterium]
MAEENSSAQNPTDEVALPKPGNPFTWLFHPFGARAIRINGNLGAIAIFFFRAFVQIFHPKQFSAIVQQIYFIGAKSAQIVMLVGFFTGMVLGLQLYHVLVKFGSVGVLGTAVALSLIREMGPVLTAIMVTARAGSAMTAEIGIQRISEQIDALSTMRIDPVGFLISPRIAAAIISFPILTTFFDLIG